MNWNRFLMRSHFALGMPMALIALIALPLTARGQDKKSEEGGKKAEQSPKKEKSQKTPAEPEKPKRVILIFPTDTKGGITDQISDSILEAFRNRIGQSALYRGIVFQKSMPVIRRAVLDQSLTAAEIDKPYDQPDKMKKLAQFTRSDLVMVSSVDDYQYDADKNEVTMIMSARLVEYKGDKATVLAAAGDTGKSAAGTPKNKPEIRVAVDTAKELADRLIQQLLKPKTGTPTVEPMP
jgi:hypothetical protein